MKRLYVDFVQTRRFDLEKVADERIWAALQAQGISVDYQGETLDDVLRRVDGTHGLELALCSLVGDTSEFETVETWELVDWSDEDDAE